jgi:uncharacterized protein with GYD domain
MPDSRLGIKSVKECPTRGRQAKAAFTAKGVELEQVWWTLGAHDLVAILSAADGLDLAAVLLELGGAGNVRTTTLRAFAEPERACVFRLRRVRRRHRVDGRVIGRARQKAVSYHRRRVGARRLSRPSSCARSQSSPPRSPGARGWG